MPILKFPKGIETIELIKGEIQIPEQYILSEKKKRLTIRTPWSVKVSRLDKDNFHISTQMWFRSKKMKEKPFIPEGFIEFDGIRYKVIVKPRTQATLTELSLNKDLVDFSTEKSQIQAHELTKDTLELR